MNRDREAIDAALRIWFDGALPEDFMPGGESDEWCARLREKMSRILALPVGGGVEFPDARPEFNPINAINWALEHEPDLRGCSDFLHFWREGNLAEYPDYVAWAAALSPRSADGQASSSKPREES